MSGGEAGGQDQEVRCPEVKIASFHLLISVSQLVTNSGLYHLNFFS